MIRFRYKKKGKNMNLKKILISSLVVASTLFAGNYNVDKSHSSVGFKVKHMMISNVKGTFDEFQGKFTYDEKTNTLKTFNGKIKVSSINTANKDRDDHLKSEEIFSAKKYPEITFKLTSIKGDTAYGDLTMKGITKNIKLDYEVGGTMKDPWGNHIAAFALSGKLKRSDYGIKWNKVLEAGGVAVSDTVKLEIEIEGKKEK